MKLMGIRGDNPLKLLVIAASFARRRSLTVMASKTGGCTVTTIPAISDEHIRQAAADVLLIDADSLPVITTALCLLEEFPHSIGAIVLVDAPDPAWVRRALSAGVNAILSREVSADELQLAVQAAEAGLLLLHPTSAANLLQQNTIHQNLTSTEHLSEELTRREQQILRLLSEGLGNKEIAFRLNISDHTVKFHISSILGKLGAGSRTEAVSQGIRRGLIAI